MCRECWAEAGRPANWSPAIARALELTKDLYAIHAVGGPLHVAIDDCNLDGHIVPYYDCYTPAELDELYDGGWKIADLDPLAPVVVEGLGRSMRQICDELADLLNAMPMDDRMSVIAFHGGYATVPGGGHDDE